MTSSQKLVSMTTNTAPSGVNIETPVILPTVGLATEYTPTPWIAIQSGASADPASRSEAQAEQRSREHSVVATLNAQRRPRRGEARSAE